MALQGLSNSLWAAAQLEDAAPEVLKIVPAIVAEIHCKGRRGEFFTSGWCVSVWAVAQLRASQPDLLKMVLALLMQEEYYSTRDRAARWADVPDVAEIVPGLVLQLRDFAADMKLPELVNTFEALAWLDGNIDSIPSAAKRDCVAALVAQLSRILPELHGKDLQNAVPAAVRSCCLLSDSYVGYARPPRKSIFCGTELLTPVAQRFSSQRTLAALPDWGLCAMSPG